MAALHGMLNRMAIGFIDDLDTAVEELRIRAKLDKANSVQDKF